MDVNARARSVESEFTYGRVTCVDKPARKSETVGGTLTLSVYHLGIMACIF
ncbi:hypothetical protein F383_23401 [Gossypium arboreum]|uniref:Uncharacterized protein n=1 Tax=Gossypium arboreum TaxID=29729 RepID=A0A0B0NSG5_GOSAR|nr:hypothetical protein F383_23401 [Gossypium arboreum]